MPVMVTPIFQRFRCCLACSGSDMPRTATLSLHASLPCDAAKHRHVRDARSSYVFIVFSQIWRICCNAMQCHAISCKDFRNTFHFFQRWSWQPVLLQAGIWPTLSCLQHFTTVSYCFKCFTMFHSTQSQTKSRVDEVGPEDCLTWEFHRTRCRVLQLYAVLWLRVAWNHWQIHWHSCGFTGMVGLVASSHADLSLQIYFTTVFN